MISSSSNNLYKKDVLRALSFPENTVIQFRYDLKWIDNPSEIQEGADVLICYLDIKDYALIPIRKAKVQFVDKYGDLFFIKLCLGIYPACNQSIYEVIADKKSLLISKDKKEGKFFI